LISDGNVLDVKKAVRNTALELCDKAGLEVGQVVIIGCSSSEISGFNIGSGSNADVGAVVFNEFNKVFSNRGIYIAAQCCEHLNRAIIVEQEAAAGYNVVNVVPTPEAGGAFATAAYKGFKNPVALEAIQADAGLDIGGTLIGMHLKRVAVPLRLENRIIGEATVVAARTRPPLIGGVRASYDESLM